MLARPNLGQPLQSQPLIVLAHYMMYPGYANIPEYLPEYGLYAGLADTSLCWPGPILVNHYRVNHLSYIFLVS
jgi:hypothetical protein